MQLAVLEQGKKARRDSEAQMQRRGRNKMKKTAVEIRSEVYLANQIVDLEDENKRLRNEIARKDEIIRLMWNGNDYFLSLEIAERNAREAIERTLSADQKNAPFD
jgi:hypothetical protein